MAVVPTMLLVEHWYSLAWWWDTPFLWIEQWYSLALVAGYAHPR
jgi:hypothetical protein